jgi:hypothetical protein
MDSPVRVFSIDCIVFPAEEGGKVWSVSALLILYSTAISGGKVGDCPVKRVGCLMKNGFGVEVMLNKLTR